MTAPIVSQLAQLALVNAYEPTPWLGSARARQSVLEAMSAASQRTFDVVSFQRATAHEAASVCGHAAAAITSGARGALATAAFMIAARTPEQPHMLVHPKPRTDYTNFVTATGLSILIADLSELGCRPEGAAGAVLTLRSSSNSLTHVLDIAERCRQARLPLVINAAAAPWDDLRYLHGTDALVVASASKGQGGPSSAGILLVGESWVNDLKQATATPFGRLLTPGKETLAGVRALMMEYAHGSSGEPNDVVDRPDHWVLDAMADLGFERRDRKPFWIGHGSTSGTRFIRELSSVEGGAARAEGAASALWSTRPRIVIGQVDATLIVCLDGLTILEIQFVVAGLRTALSTVHKRRGADT